MGKLLVFRIVSKCSAIQYCGLWRDVVIAQSYAQTNLGVFI